MTAVAIMQPTYLPWLGYFALMDRADVFVFLDTVQFDRRSWQQRNRIKGPNGPQILTIPVHKKGMRDQKIADVRIVEGAGFPEKHVRAIELAYGRAPYFDQYSSGLFEMLRRPCDRLADLTIALVEWLAEQLGIKTRYLRAHNLDAQGRKADLLVDICRRIDAVLYLSPTGSRAYLDSSHAFESMGIPVSYNEYCHPAYSQLHGKFATHLSAVDLLFNVGPGSLAVIRGGTV